MKFPSRKAFFHQPQPEGRIDTPATHFFSGSIGMEHWEQKTSLCRTEHTHTGCVLWLWLFSYGSGNGPTTGTLPPRPAVFVRGRSVEKAHHFPSAKPEHFGLGNGILSFHFFHQRKLNRSWHLDPTTLTSTNFFFLLLIFLHS